MLFATSLSNFNFLDYDWQLIDETNYKNPASN